MRDSFELISNYDLRSNARDLLDGNWWPCITLTLIYLLIQFVLGLIPLIGGLVSFIFAGPLQLGFTIYYLKFIRTETTDYNAFFEGQDDFGRALAAMILIAFFTMVWALLLIIPGIIAFYKYAMTFYVLKDNPELSAIDALRLSEDMMYGAKMKLFKLHLSFIGWIFLTALTAGIGQLVLIPYVMTSQTYFYEDLRTAYEQTQ